MEQKKLILVAISVGVFLVITIGAAILFVGSGNASPGIAASRAIPVGTSYIIPEMAYSVERFQPASYVLETEEFSGSAYYPANTENPAQIIVSAETPNNPANANHASANPGSAPGNTGVNSGSGNPANVKSAGDAQTVINVTRPNTTAVPDAPHVSRQTPAASAPAASAPAPAASAPAASRTPAASTPAPAPARTSAAAPVSAANQPSRSHDDFWIQTGSFTTVSRAEGVRETLSAKGIVSFIENRVLNGTTYYRVRVGPYTSKNEADYWLSLIKSINGFENSIVLQNPAI